jgi:beta-lactamase regulating signal transducer with metallopeptidase domain
MDTLLDLGLRNAVMATLLALLAAVLTYLWRRPAFAHGLWLLVLLKLLTPPLVPLPIAWPGAAETLPGAGGLPVEPPPPAEPHPNAAPLQQPNHFQPGGAPSVLAPVPEEFRPPSAPETTSRPAPDPGLSAWMARVVPFWLAGSLLWFAWMALQVVRFQRLLRRAERPPLEVQVLTCDLAARMGLRRAPTVLMVPGVVSPMLWGIGLRPRLLFPAKLLDQLNRQQQQTLLAHELAHLRRRDHWVRLLEVVVLGLYWWHPVVWWARGQLHEAEEQCCDAWVVGTLEGGARSYALALLQTVAFLSRAPSPLPVTASGIGQVPHLRRRLTMIMQGTTPRSLSRGGASLLLGLGLLLLPLLPSDAQTPVKEKANPPQTAKDPRDQQIEALKQAIKILEAQKAAEKQKADVDFQQGVKKVWTAEAQEAKQQAAEAQVRQLRAQAEDLKAVYEAKHKELQIIGEKLHAVLTKLRELQPDTKWAPQPKGYTPVRPAKVPPGADLAPQPKGYEPETKKVPTDASPANLDKGSYMHLMGKTPKGSDLEKRIEQLQKQVEELQRQVRQLRQGQPKGASADLPTTPYLNLKKGVRPDQPKQ